MYLLPALGKEDTSYQTQPLFQPFYAIRHHTYVY